MAKNDKQEKLDFIVSCFKKGQERKQILSKFGKKYKISVRSFDRLLIIAKKEYEIAKNKPKTTEEILEEIGEELNERQKAFCHEYIFDWNGTRAYKKIYNIQDDNQAASNSSRLVRNDKVKEYIKYLKENIEEASGVSLLMIVKEHKKIAFSTFRNIQNTWIERKEFEEIKKDYPEILDCIQEVDTKTEKKVQWEYDEDKGKKSPVDYDVEYVKIKFYSKQDSLKELTKIIGGYSPEKSETKFDLPEGTIIKWGDKEVKI